MPAFDGGDALVGGFGPDEGIWGLTMLGEAHPHPHSGATYRLVPQADNSVEVEVTIPGMSPTTVTGTGSQAEAERWTAKHKDEVAAGWPERPV